MWMFIHGGARLCPSTSTVQDQEYPTSSIFQMSSSHTCTEQSVIPTQTGRTLPIYSWSFISVASVRAWIVTNWSLGRLIWRETISDPYVTNKQINVISRIHVSKEKKGRRDMAVCCSNRLFSGHLSLGVNSDYMNRRCGLSEPCYIRSYRFRPFVQWNNNMKTSTHKSKYLHEHGFMWAQIVVKYWISRWIILTTPNVSLHKSF